MSLTKVEVYPNDAASQTVVNQWQAILTALDLGKDSVATEVARMEGMIFLLAAISPGDKTIHLQRAEKQIAAQINLVRAKTHKLSLKAKL